MHPSRADIYRDESGLRLTRFRNYLSPALPPRNWGHFNLVFIAICLGWGLTLGVIPNAEANESESGTATESFVQEVFQTELVYPQAQGEVQLALRMDHADSDDGNTLMTSAEIEYGLTDVWQFGAEWQALVLNSPEDAKTTRGVGDLELGTKYSFPGLGDGDTHAAVGFELGLPTGDVERGLGEGLLELSPSIMVARDVNAVNGLNLFAQVGIGFVSRVNGHDDPADDEPEAHEFFLGGGGIMLLSEVLAASLELNWRDNSWNHDGDESALWLTPGIHFCPAAGWQIGAGLAVQLDSDESDWSLGLLLVSEF